MYYHLSAQTERYIYETWVNPDTINLVDMKMEKTFLDIRGQQSVFVSENKLLKDSLNFVLRNSENQEPKKSKKKDKADFPKLPNGKTLQPTFFEFFIIKDGATVNFVENVGSRQVYYPEDRKLNWNISEQFSDFNGYKIQKATVHFGGRIWTAWFAPEIKISDGPYKFSGLPGLILKLEDNKGDYRFSFLKKISLQNNFSESIKPEARQSTRINFKGDKAAVMLELKKEKNSPDTTDFQHPNGGRGMPMGGGMHPGGTSEMGGAPEMNTIQNTVGNSGNSAVSNSFNTNPIELKP